MTTKTLYDYKIVIHRYLAGLEQSFRYSQSMDWELDPRVKTITLAEAFAATDKGEAITLSMRRAKLPETQEENGSNST